MSLFPSTVRHQEVAISFAKRLLSITSIPQCERWLGLFVGLFILLLTVLMDPPADLPLPAWRAPAILVCLALILLSQAVCGTMIKKFFLVSGSYLMAPRCMRQASTLAHTFPSQGQKLLHKVEKN